MEFFHFFIRSILTVSHKEICLFFCLQVASVKFYCLIYVQLLISSPKFTSLRFNSSAGGRKLNITTIDYYNTLWFYVIALMLLWIWPHEAADLFNIQMCCKDTIRTGWFDRFTGKPLIASLVEKMSQWMSPAFDHRETHSVVQDGEK